MRVPTAKNCLFDGMRRVLAEHPRGGGAKSGRGSTVATSEVRVRPSSNQVFHFFAVDKLVPDFSGRIKTLTWDIGEPPEVIASLHARS
ncbi:hypothetical protein RB195_020052 [Necator americanus]|uniref:Uncharacterized protein n=1 Tax=Necator americanus TaxID=51031 RepID=A0ABR1CIX1_NECAM